MINRLLISLFLLYSMGNLHAQDTLKGRSNILRNVEIVQQLSDSLGPSIAVIDPAVKRGVVLIVQNQKVDLLLKVTDPSGVSSVTVNGQRAVYSENHLFRASLICGYGVQMLRVSASDTRGNVSLDSFALEIRDPADAGGFIAEGEYYALIIGNNQYTDPSLTPLSRPVNDARKLYQTLTEKYTFDTARVTLLTNATYVQMITAFDRISGSIGSGDNLLIFYAGHGYWDEARQLGYWLPCDARRDHTAFWIRNSTISDYMSSISARHILLIADACFSGSIFKTRSASDDIPVAVKTLYSLKSRKAMTSGNLKEVSDQSVFLDYLVKRLEENKDKYLSADLLFSAIRQSVMNNSSSEPLYGTIQNAGDEGGEFIFIKK